MLRGVRLRDAGNPPPEDDGAMPDTETITTEDAPVVDDHLEVAADDAPVPAEPEPAGEEPADLGDSGKQALVAERDARRQAERKLKTVEQQLQEVTAALKSYEDRDKTELELLREKAEAAEAKAAQAEQERQEAEYARLRQKVASEKRVPAERLTGTTEEELLAEADDLLAWASTMTPPPKKPQTEGLKSGASGVENPTVDLKEHAARQLVRFRKSSG